ncbi:lactate racemase domain-containing protein [Telmatospirillum sp. J64-1]|uniref:lactate racemase domain-containing protein n=1 Tax=Telmatospirillum sp. J64-1 TaxID=2502183 RepID=UPI00115EF6BB|nr:lactate racemase domain-containing protein [Telmatospirillum sp. J64-1]
MAISTTFPVVNFPHLSEVQLPLVAPVRLYHREGQPITDIAGRTRQIVRSAARLQALAPGASVAIGVGSRGISAVSEIVAAVVAELKAMGLQPFIVPAMGSHGGGTAEGQEAVLAKLGVREETVGAPVRATMEVVDYGKTRDGIDCKFDGNAAGADGIIVINRVKSHTTFDRPIESGLTKMVAVGFGKAEGARRVHKLGPRGLRDVLPELASIALRNAPIALGIALVEDSHKRIVCLEGAAPEEFHTTDERLLVEAKSYLARLPFEQLDVLIVERIGKEISGTGMDYAVSGRTDIRGVPNPPAPFIHKIGVLNLTKETGGNSIGLGVADFTTKAAADAVDFRSTYMNALTAALVEKSRIPVVLPTERDVIAAAVTTSWVLNDSDARFCLIASTMHLDEILVSPAVLRDLPIAGKAEQIGDLRPLAFDDAGRLRDSLWARFTGKE